MNASLRSIVRLTGAITAAASAAAAPTILLGAFVLIAFPIGFVIALAHILLLGLPAYFLLRRCGAFDWGIAVLSGFVIGAVPAGLFSLPSMGFIGGISTRAMAGLCGALGALAFRAVLGNTSPAPEIFDSSIWE